MFNHYPTRNLGTSKRYTGGNLQLAYYSVIDCSSYTKTYTKNNCLYNNVDSNYFVTIH